MVTLFDSNWQWYEYRELLPELIISGAVSNVAHKKLLGVSPALPLVVTQFHLKLTFFTNSMQLQSVASPSFSSHGNHVFHSGSESLLEMQTQSPCGQTCKSNRMSSKKFPYKIILESVTSTERGVWYWPIILYHFTLSHSSECLEQRTDFVIAHLHRKLVKTCQ